MEETLTGSPPDVKESLITEPDTVKSSFEHITPGASPPKLMSTVPLTSIGPKSVSSTTSAPEPTVGATELIVGTLSKMLIVITSLALSPSASVISTPKLSVIISLGSLGSA